MYPMAHLAAGFDVAALIPDLNTVVGWVQLVCRLCVMAGPMILLGFGLLYLLKPPKEANHSLGYRCWWGMASLEAWQFTQRLAGMVWSALGLLLIIIMTLVGISWSSMSPPDMVWSAVVCLLWELGLTGAACLGINITVIVFFDIDGFRRKSPDK